MSGNLPTAGRTALNFIVFFFLAIAWGSSYYWIKIALLEIPPTQIVSLRVTIASIGLVVLMGLYKQHLPRTLELWKKMSILSLLSIITPFMFLSWGVTQISSALTGVLNGTIPLFTVCIAHYFLPDERLNRTKFMGLVFGFSGSVLLVKAGQAEATINSLAAANSNPQGALLGALAVLFASMCYGFGAIYVKKKLSHVEATTKATTVTLIAAVVLTTIHIVITLAQSKPLSLPVQPNTWMALIWMGLIGSCFAYVAYFWLLKEWGPTRVSFVMYLAPLVAVTIGTIALKERAGPELIIGGTLVLMGVAIANLEALTYRVTQHRKQRHGK